MTPQESNWCGAEMAPRPSTSRKTRIRTTGTCRRRWPSSLRTIRLRPASRRTSKVKSRWIIGFLLTCALAISANAQENSGVQTSEGPIANLARQNSGSTTSPATQLQAPAGSQDAGAYPNPLEEVVGAMSAELGQIAQAAREALVIPPLVCAPNISNQLVDYLQLTPLEIQRLQAQV